MQIKTLADKTGLSDSTIRYYESIGLLPEPGRLFNGYRDYDEDNVARLQFVAGARTLDFSLGDIAEILALRERPDSLIVQGGNAVGLELAQTFARVGIDVTLVERLPLPDTFTIPAQFPA